MGPSKPGQMPYYLNCMPSHILQKPLQSCTEADVQGFLSPYVDVEKVP